jgi:hypothetical protein
MSEGCAKIILCWERETNLEGKLSLKNYLDNC